MTPKEKAENLFQLFLPFVGYSPNIQDIKYMCKQCCYILVNEILSQDVFDYTSDWSNTIEYWQEVKQEINKL